MSETQPETRRRIRERAYYLWLEEGCPEGRADAHWRQACKELDAAAREEAERRMDAEEEDSFPASDPPSHTGITGERAA